MSDSEHSRRFFVPPFSQTDERHYIDLNAIAHNAIRSAEADCQWATKGEQIRVIVAEIINALNATEDRPSESIVNPVE